MGKVTYEALFLDGSSLGEYLCLCFLGRNRILGPVELGEPVLVSMISGNVRMS